MLERTDTLERGLKLPGKSRWRPAFLSREGRSEKGPQGQDQQWKKFDDFFHKSSQNDGGSANELHPQLGSDDGDTRFAEPDFPPREEQHRINHPARRAPRSTGLSVAFCTEAPEIIGEGGDEASSPPITISKHPKSRPNMKASSSHLKHDSYSKHKLSQPRDIGRIPVVKSLSALSWPSENIALAAAEDGWTGHDGQYMANEGSATEKGLKALQATEVEPSHQALDQTQDHHVSPLKPPHNIPEVGALKSLLPTIDGEGPRGDRCQSIPAETLSENPFGEMSISHSRPGREYTETEIRSGVFTEPPAARTLQNVVKSLAADAFADFSARVDHLYQLFRLGLSSTGSSSGRSFEDWIRAAVWWFLRGRKELEQAVRMRSQKNENTAHCVVRELTIELRQAYVDLAKAWWIVMEIAPNDHDFLEYTTSAPMTATDVAKRFGVEKPTIIKYGQLYSKLKSCMRGLAISMKRNDKLPPSSLEATHLNLGIWTNTSNTLREIENSVLSTIMQIARDDTGGSLMHFHNSLGDTEDHFNYGSMFVDLQIRQDGGKDLGEDQLHCLLTILRRKGDFGVQARISGQTGSFSFAIAGNGTCRFGWENIRWHTRQHILSIKTSEGKVIELNFFEKDFKTLWSIQEHAVKVQRSTDQAKHEHQLRTFTLQSFHHASTPPNTSFPSELPKDCVVRLFEIWTESHEGMGMRQKHHGVRFHIASPPSAKALNYMNLQLNQGNPILFSYMRGEADAPALLLKLNDGQRDSKSVLTFKTREDRTLFHAHLDGTLMTGDESCSESMPLEVAARSRPSSSASTSVYPADFLDSIPWQQLRVIARNTTGSNPPISKMALPQRLRIWVECPFGSLVDRINVDPGALALSLDIEKQTELRLSWPDQGDSTVSFSSSQLSKDHVEALRKCLRTQDGSHAAVKQKSRTYRFSSLEDLHRFQTWTTNYRPTFDGLAAGFSISRRRMVVPLHKRLESSLTRLQVLTQGRITQLLAFFKDLPLGSCMCFILKSTDKYESFSRSGRFHVRFVDAKFALPRSMDEANHDFISLDTPEYATEHDDIFIAFNTEEGKLVHTDTDMDYLTDPGDW